MNDPERRGTLHQKLTDLRHLALDLDGTLYLGGRLFEFTKPFLARLAELGIGRTFFTYIVVGVAIATLFLRSAITVIRAASAERGAAVGLARRSA